MEWGGHAVIYFLVLCFGCWPFSQSCRTNWKKCEEMMDAAANLPTAGERCSGARAYLACVQKDIANCTGNRYNDQYASNIVGLYCSSAYICSQELRECYVHFQNAVRGIIRISDPVNQEETCSNLTTNILKCQESVTSRCKNQPGLIETVKKFQQDLYTVCNNTDPCSKMMLMCHKSIIDIGNPDNAPPSNNDQQSECGQQKPIDYCGAYRQAASCIRSGLDTCKGRLTMENTLANLDNTTAQQCDPLFTCGQKVSACMCYINKEDLSSPMALMTTICASYPNFKRCLDDVGEECYAVPKIRAKITMVKAGYLKHYKLYCTKEGGLCPPALQCLVKLPEDLSPSSPPPTRPTADFHINKLCLGDDYLFHCLKNATTHCDQEPGDVTFPMIDDVFRRMCADLQPHRDQLMECDSINRCLEDFHRTEVGVSSLQDFGRSYQNVQRMYVGLTYTEYWCNYLTHGFRCIGDAGPTCSLSDELIAVALLRGRDLQQVCRGPTTPAPTAPSTGTPEPDGGLTVRPSKGNGADALHSRHHGVLLAALILAAIHIRH